MEQAGQNRIKILIIVFLFSFPLFSEVKENKKFFGWTTSVDILINSGISYNFKITTDYNNQAQLFSLDVPFSVGVDTRFIEWFSLYGSLEVLYSVNSYKNNLQNKENLYYIHSMFIRLPFIVKFYPMVYKSDDYANFYLSSGLVLHFWPINYYQIYRENIIFSGNSYFNRNDFMPPLNSYNIANIGIRLSVGNQFKMSKRGIFGLELYFLYLFLPYLNGYYFNNNYNLGGPVIIEFTGMVGITLTFGIRVKGDE